MAVNYNAHRQQALTALDFGIWRVFELKFSYHVSQTNCVLSVKNIFSQKAKANYIHQHFSSNLPYGVTYLYCGTDKPTKRQMWKAKSIL